MKYLIPLLFIAGCATVEVTSVPANIDHSTGISAIRAELKDPYSAKFSSPRAFALSNGDTIYCGKVNAKNSYGAYTGSEIYFVRRSDGVVKTAFIGGLAGEGCKRAANGKIPLRN